jgi:hypothetical protein
MCEITGFLDAVFDAELHAPGSQETLTKALRKALKGLTGDVRRVFEATQPSPETRLLLVVSVG